MNASAPAFHASRASSSDGSIGCIPYLITGSPGAAGRCMAWLAKTLRERRDRRNVLLSARNRTRQYRRDELGGRGVAVTFDVVGDHLGRMVHAIPRRHAE